MSSFAIIRSTFTLANLRWLGTECMKTLRRYYMAVISFVLTLGVLTQFFFVGISVDSSLPNDHLYVVKKWDATPFRGGKFGILTVDGPMGPPGGLVLAKYIYGMPGDFVEIGGEDGRDIFINGDWVAHAKRFSKTGKPLAVAKGGIIPDGMYFVGTPSKDSYDSRYATMGLVARDRIMGRVVTLF